MSLLKFIGNSGGPVGQIGVGISSVVGPTGAQGAQGPFGGPQGYQGAQGSNVWSQTGSNIFYNLGNVGVGTDYPNYKLDVVGGTSRFADSKTSPSYLINLGGSGTNSNFRSAYIYGNGQDMTFLNQETGSVIFGTNNQEKVRFTNQNQFLFGTTTPISAGSLTGTMLISKPFPSDALTVHNGYYLGLGAGEYNSTGTSYRLIGMGYRNQTIDSYWPSYMGYKTNTDEGRTNGHLVFGTRNVTTDIEPMERMRISSDGNVGIGTTILSPFNSGKQFPTLSLGTSIGTGSQVGSSIELMGTNPLIYTSGYPSASNINRPVILMNRAGVNYAAIGVNDSASTDSGLWLGETTYLGSTGGTSNPYIFIKNGGNVGINTTSPITPLDIKGTIHQSSTGIQNDTFMRSYNSYYSTGYTFYPTSSVQTFTTSSDITSVEIECWGAGGGGPSLGGYGGYSKAVMTGLTGPTTFKLWVGDVGEGGATYTTPTIDCTILYSGPARQVPPFYYADTNFGYFITGPTGAQTYLVATVRGNQFWADNNELSYNINERYYNGGVYPQITGNQIKWTSGLTGTIFMTGAYPVNGYGQLFLKNYELIYGNTGVNTYIVYTNTGLYTYTPTYSTGDSGGGASFVYVQTGSQYQLLSVAGGGGAAGISQNMYYIQPLNSFQGAFYAEYLGANSETSATNNLVTGFFLSQNPYYSTGTSNSLIFGQAGSNNTGGRGGTGTTGTYSFINGGNGMPLLTSSVNGNISCSGGRGSYVRVNYGPAITTLFSVTGTTMFVVSGGGGGRGFGGGGGGASAFYIYTGTLTDLGPLYDSGSYQNCTGDSGGGGGGGNYSINGSSYTAKVGFNTGSYELPYARPGDSGIIKITTYGYSMPSFTISPTGNNNLSQYQTQGLTVSKDGSVTISNKMSIGKANPEATLDIAGDVNAIGNVIIPNYQNIFKSTTFNKDLYNILQNNFNYNPEQENVSLNYSLAAISLELGYIQNALSGLSTMLTYAFGTYDEYGNLSDTPNWLKNWIANFLPVSSTSLLNYNTAQLTSANPSRDYYLNEGTLLPFGEWAYKFYLTLTPQVIFSYEWVGVYVENNKYYIYTDKYHYGNLTNVAYNYVTNSVFSTQNTNLLFEYNNPTGAYQFNILGGAYTGVQEAFNTTTIDLVMYTNYYDPYSTEILPYYDPTSIYVSGNNDNLYNPSSEMTSTGPSFWSNHVFYDFKNFYTGNFSSGYFIGNLRPNLAPFALHNQLLFEKTQERLKDDATYKMGLQAFMDSLNDKVTSYMYNFRAAASSATNRNITSQPVIKVPVVTTKAGTVSVSKITTSTSGQATLNSNISTNLQQVGTVQTSADQTKR